MSQKIYTNLDIKGNATIGDIINATSDTDKFLVSDAGVVKYRTGSEMLSDLGVAPGVASNVQHQVKAGVAINKGQAVYVTSADGTNMIVGLASNTSEATSSKTMGLLDNTVAVNGFANVVTEGLLSGLNTIGANSGDPVWLGTSGNLIYGLANKPSAPAHLVFIGIVTRVNANNGEIFIKAQNGFELNEIHDVDLKSTPASGNDILAYEGAPVNLWKNKSIAAVLGYTPYNASNPAGYISSYTETDPTVPSHVKSITTTEKSNWNTAFGWGNHASAGYALSGHTHDLGRYSLRAPALIDSVTSSNFRTQLFGSSTSGYNISTARFNTTPGLLSGLNNYGTMMAWSGSDTHGFLAIDYAGPAAIIGGGNADNINWTKRLAFLDDTVPNNRTITINGTSYDLSANRSWTVTTSETDTLQTVTSRGATTSTILTTTSTSSGATIIAQSNGTSATWRGRIGSFNATADKASFIGTYAGNAVVGAHNNALTAWADLYINTVDGLSGGNVRLPELTVINGNTAIHAGNYNSYSPTLTGGNASGTWGISITGSAGSVAWTNVSGRPTAVSSFTNDAGYATSATNRWYDGWVTNPGYDANTIGESKSGFTYSNNAPLNGTLVHFASGGYGLQLNSNYTTGVCEVSFRSRQGDMGVWGTWGRFLSSSNYSSYAWPLEGSWKPSSLASSTRLRGATSPDGGEFGLAYSGGQIHPYTDGFFYQNEGQYRVIDTNSISSYALPANSQSNWSSVGGIGNVVGMLAWKNYGNNHVIFDASASTTPSGTPCSNTNSAQNWSPTYPTLMGWNGSTTYGVRVDTARYADNSGTVGGYSVSTGASANTIPTRNGSGYLIPENWIQLNGYYGLYSPNNGAHLKPNDSSYGAWKILGERNGWRGLHFGEGSGMTLMMNETEFGFHREGNGWYARFTQNTGHFGISGTAARATRANGNFYIDDNYGNTVVGVYNASRLQGVFAMGDAYKLAADGTSAGNLYGLAWSHPNAGGQAGFLSDHGLIHMMYGTAFATISSNIWCRGDIIAYSDARVKDNIQVIDNPLERLKKVRGVTFTRTDLINKEKRYAGVIAQEMLEALPEVVSENVNGELSVSYGNSVSLLIECIKEQQVQIDELKKLINQLTDK